MKFQIIAENACMMIFENKPNILSRLHYIKQKIDQDTSLPITETVIGYVTLTVYYDFFSISDEELEAKLRQIAENTVNSGKAEGKLFDIPVCYDEEFGMDLEFMKTTHSMSAEELISVHTAPIYTVSFLGFSPGFPFLSGMDNRLNTARKKNPRLTIPKGSVGIAGGQTGVYPSQSPGGWQIIGRTPLELLPLHRNQPALLKPGDKVRFVEISKEEYWYKQLEEEPKNDNRNN